MDTRKGFEHPARLEPLFLKESFSLDAQLVHIEEQLQPVTKDAAEPLKSSSAVRAAPVLQEAWAPFHRRGVEGRVLAGTSGRARSVAFTLIKREAKLDLPGVGYHSLRHTWAKVLLQERGATLLQLSAACGHSHYATTEKYYLHLCRDQMTESLRALAAPQPSPGAPWTAPNTVVGTGVGTEETNYSNFLDA